MTYYPANVLAFFFYRLLMHHLPAGTVEQLVQRATWESEALAPLEPSGHVWGHAQELSQRVLPYYDLRERVRRLENLADSIDVYVAEYLRTRDEALLRQVRKDCHAARGKELAGIAAEGSHE